MQGRTLSRPGRPPVRRQLHFIWLLDCSGSMSMDGKIQALNHAIREVLPHMKKMAADNPDAAVVVRAIAISTGARWHTSQPVPIDRFQWTDVKAKGETHLGHALQLILDDFNQLATSQKLYPPLLVLVSDGRPTDLDRVEQTLQALQEHALGQVSVRIAIAIGQDADIRMLEQFVGKGNEHLVLQANNPEALVHYVKMVSTVVLGRVSEPVRPNPSSTRGELATSQLGIPKPPPPQSDAPISWP